jgi:hypothetical protein
MYEVWVDSGELTPHGTTKYAVLDVNGRSEWKTKRIAKKHAREYKAIHLRDSWVSEV